MSALTGATLHRLELNSLAGRMGDDELRVLVTLARRLAMGREQYGELRIDRDRRDWTKEASEEALDLSVYLAIALLKR